MFGSGKALKLGLDFFGSEHVVFSTDAPLGPIKKTIDALQEQGVDDKTMAAIMSGNVRRMLRLP
jgi:predicted TIM-barrel fold metal-dependent hydrolase